MFDALMKGANNGGGDLASNFSSKQKKEDLSKVFEMGAVLNNVNNLMVDVMMIDIKKLKDKYGFPATIKKAKQHLHALRYGFHEHHDHNEKIQICACCDMELHTQRLSICGESTTVFSQNPEKEFRMSSSVAFFFTFIKYVVIMFCLRFIVVDSFNLFSNIFNGSYCREDCSSQFWSYASLIYKYNREDLMLITDILSFVCIIILLPFFLFYRRFQYNMYDIIDSSNQTQDDYSIFVEYIPVLDFPAHVQDSGNIQFNYDKDLDELFSSHIRQWLQNEHGQHNWVDPEYGSLEKNYNDMIEGSNGRYDRRPDDIVKSITLCYDISRIEKIHEHRSKIMTEYEAAVKQNPQKDVEGIDNRFSKGPQQVNFLNETELVLCKSYAQDKSVVFNATHFVGAAFISFKYQHFRDYLLEKYSENRESYILKGHRLRITEATFPSDIKWKNLRISRVERRNRVIMAYVILCAFLGFGFALLVGSDRLKALILQNIHDNDGMGAMGVTLITTIVTLLINFGLQTLSYQLTEWEHHQNKSNQKFSLTVKLVITQFLNTALIYFILSLIRQENKTGLMSQEGLVFQVSSLIVTSGVIQIIMNIIDIPAVIRILYIKWFYRGKSDDDEINEFQVHLNRTYELVEFDIAQRYSYYILQLWTVSAYVYIVPICGPALIIILSIQYWVDKYNLFKRSSLFFELNYGLSRDILKLSEFSVFLYALGIIVFSAKIFNTVHPLSIVGIAIAFIYICLSWLLPKKYERRLFQKYATCETISYDDCQKEGKFQEMYWYLNPATKLIDESICTDRKVRKFKNKKELVEEELVHYFQDAEGFWQ